MKNKSEKINNYLVIGYPTLVLFTSTLRSYLIMQRRTIFLAAHMIPVILVSFFILFHYLPKIKNELINYRIKEKNSFFDILAIIAFFEINLVTLLYVMNGTTVPARAVDVPFYDIILVTGYFISKFVSEKDRDLMLRILSLVIMISAVLYLFEIVIRIINLGQSEGLWFSRDPYTDSRGIFRNGLCTVFMVLLGFWLPPFFPSKKAGILQKVLCALILFFSTRRGMLVGLVFSCGMYLVWNGKKMLSWFEEKKRNMWVKIIIGAFIILFIMIWGYLQFKLGRLSNFSGSHAVNGRLGMTAETLRRIIFEDTWGGRIFGHGRDTIERFMRSWKGFDDLLQEHYGPHNQYTVTLYEFGIIGLFSMIYLMVRGLQIGKYLTGNKRAIGFCIIALVFPSMFDDIGDYYFMSSMAVMMTALMLPFIDEIKKQKNASL